MPWTDEEIAARVEQVRCTSCACDVEARVDERDHILVKVWHEDGCQAYTDIVKAQRATLN